MRAIVLALVLSGCSAASPYQCVEGEVVPVPGCLPDDPPDGPGWVYWEGCAEPDTWRFGATPAVPDGSCSVGERRGSGHVDACNGTRVGNTACDFGCGWVQAPSSDECEALRQDCVPRDAGGNPLPPGTYVAYCEYAIGDVP